MFTDYMAFARNKIRHLTLITLLHYHVKCEQVHFVKTRTVALIFL